MKIYNKEIYTIPQIMLLIFTGLLLGFLVITQSRYFTSYVSSVGRDSSENIFRKIQILKTTNDELADVIIDLESQLQEVSSQADALKSIEKEIIKNEMIAGDIKVYGPGVEINIENQISGIWFTDLVNELLASGAEAVTINNIRLTDSTMGFDTLPNGQIMVNNVILNPPYTFNAIGDKLNLKQALEAAGGIMERLKATYIDMKISVTEKDRIEMGKI